MATANTTLITTFQLLGAAPITITLEVGQIAEYHSAPSTPDEGDPVQRLVQGTDRTWRTFNGSNNVYARKPANAGETIIGHGE